MLVDVHCHLDHHLYKGDIDKIIENAKKAGVVRIVTSGIDYNTNKIALALAEKYDIVEAALGRYPEDALNREGYFENNPNIERSSIDQDIEFIRRNKDKIVAIGECGLDLHNGKDIELQKSVFRKLIELSIELNKVLVIHSRKAEREAIEMLLKYKGKLNPRKVILHCFSGRKSLIDISIKEGYNFSIPTNIVRAENFQGLVSKAPLKQLLTETDGPYLSPFKNEDNSFNRNEPAYVAETIKVMSRLKNITEEECKNQIFMNYQNIFSK
jgi:TatD DNase family protein